MKNQNLLVIAVLVAVACTASAEPKESALRPAYPHPGPIAGADPAVREEQEVLVPTAFIVERTADRLSVSEDNRTLKPIKLSVGLKMELGMETELYIYPVGTIRSAEPISIGQGGVPRAGPSRATSFFYPKPDGFLKAGTPYVVELKITIFETDIPSQHLWSPTGGKYKVLWQQTLKQKAE